MRFSLSRAIAQQALDSAFLSLLCARTTLALLDGDMDSFRADVFDLCETLARGTLAIDSNLPG